MKTNFYIDIDNSISKGWLKMTYRENWLDKFNRITYYFLFLALLTYPTIILVSIADYSNPNDKAFSIFLGLMILFALYGIYRKIFERRLTIIQNEFPRDRIKSILTDYFDQKGYEIKLSKNCIIGKQEESLSFNNLYSKKIIVIYDDNYLGFVMSKDFPKLNPPVFFTHYFIKKDLRKLLKTVEI